MMPYCGTEIGPRGAEKKINPVDVWLANSQRVIVSGCQMRPDKERPTFEEHGETWINTYAPPDLGPTEGGSVDMGLEFFVQLLPDPRERKWFMQWLAYKWQNPHIPGPSVIMLARSYGTGRGTFGRLLSLLFGSAYVANVPFSIFSGQSYQSQYTDWAANALFTCVDESSTSSDGKSAYKTKHDVYEHLKMVADPRPTERLVVRKGEPSYMTTSCCTNVIMTNNPDALPLPADDRRFVVLVNGMPRDPQFWQDVNDWLARRENVAALGAYLTEYDTGDYDPFGMPLMTYAKEDMTILNKSELDRLLDDVMETIDGPFVPEQIIRRMADIDARERRGMPDKWQGATRRELRQRFHALRYENGRKLSPMIDGSRYEVFAKTERAAKRYSSSADLRADLTRNGNVFSSVANKLNRREG